MRRFFSQKSGGLYINPPIWRGPSCELSKHILRHGVDIKSLGIPSEASRSTSKMIGVFWIVRPKKSND